MDSIILLIIIIILNLLGIISFIINYIEKYNNNNYGKMLHIIVPYRDRKNNLNKLLPRLEQYISRNYKVWVIEQYDKKLFRRGNLLNIGYKELKKRGIIKNTDDIVLHDVDDLPLIGKGADYSKSSMGVVRQLFGGSPNWKTLGGIILMNASDFEKVNGFSTRFIGYGKEDDDFYLRVQRAGMIIDRKNTSFRVDDPNEPRFEELEHDKPTITLDINIDRNKIVEDNIKRLQDSINNPTLQQKEGLNTTLYKIVSENVINNNTVKLSVLIK